MKETGYKIRNQFEMHYLTFQVVDWIDIFTRSEYKDIIINSFKYCHKHQVLKIHGYVIMSNHVHCILRATLRKYDLSTVIKNFKSFTKSPEKELR